MSYTVKIENGDVVRNHSNTGYETITRKDKLRQDCRMVLTTGIRADGIGCGLDEVIGKHTDGEPENAFGSPAMFEFQSRASSGISRFRYVQRHTMFSRRTPEELLDSYTPVQIWPDTEDPRTFRWRVDFYSFLGKYAFSLEGLF